MRLTLSAVGLAAVTFSAAPALAHDHRPGPEASHYDGYDPAGREEWLADCRQRLSSRDSGVGGAAIGGLVGGVAGNRIAGRGNRTVGTIAGAAVGAAAGAVIDKAEDRGRNREECEAYLDDYYTRYTQGGYGAGYRAGYGYPQQGYYSAYGQPVMMVPVMMVPAMQMQPQPPHCTETVEYVYEDVPVRPARRVIPRRSKAVPDKRVKIGPDKRVPIK